MDGRSTSRVKNKAPAPIQITAEQLLREAQEHQEAPLQAPKQRVEDYEELHEFRGRKRKEFEEVIRRTRSNISAWTKYAYWEASQGEYARSRSVYERALDVEPTDVKLWLSYTEMELKARNVQHARNLFDRAVTLLPRINQIWYKYVYLEELLGNVAGARQVFERWMAWEPDEKAWTAYIKMELRYHEYARASQIYERLVACHPEPKIWIKWAKYEEEVRSNVNRSREVYQMALEYFGAGEGGAEEEEQLEKAQSLYNAFAKLEIRQKEYERARVIYKYALDRLPRSKSANLYTAYSHFEKQFGDKTGIESTVLGKRRIEYEEDLKHTPMNYDTWIDYCRLEEDAFRSEGVSAKEGGADRVREVYERAVAMKPPGNEKRHWTRYIFLWINYALFEEIDAKDIERTRQIYDACIKLIPHKEFTFAKIWTLYAEFELRQLDINKARKIMGSAIGLCPKEKLFKDYITMELQLREFDRCRQLYQKYLTYDPSNSTAFIKFAELEKELGDLDRARGIFELAISQPLDMPEVLWKAYIDFEYEEEEWDRTRELYKRLLERTSHVKVWISWAQFESNAGKTIARAYRDQDDDEYEEDEEAQEETEPKPEKVVSPEAEEAAKAAEQSGLEQAREVFKKGYKDLKDRQLKQERLILLEAWKALETADGDADSLAKVEAMMPRVVKKRRKVGNTDDMEEYFDLLFADDEQEKPQASKLLLAAAKWKAEKEKREREAAAAAANGSS